MKMIKTPMSSLPANGHAVDMRGSTYDAWHRTSAVAYDAMYLVFASRDEAAAFVAEEEGFESFATEGEEIIPCYWAKSEGMDDGAFCVWVEEADD